jgi:hypothetical protein
VTALTLGGRLLYALLQYSRLFSVCSRGDFEDAQQRRRLTSAVSFRSTFINVSKGQNRNVA